MAAIVLTILATPASAPGEVVVASSGRTGAQGSTPRVAGAVPSSAAVLPSSGRVTATVALETHRCVPNLRRAVVSRRASTWHWQDELGIFHTRTARKARTTTSCAYLRWIKRYWALSADRHYRSWIATFTLNEHPYDGLSDPWPAAVNEVQRVFPGSRDWVLSCSDAEGWNPGLTYWQTFGGGHYYPGFEHEYVVGGPGQFKYPTFKGMHRRGVEYAISKGYRVPSHLRHPTVTAWRSPLGQAIAMGAAYSLGLRGSHWSASYSRGC